jgi:hypothetical protein
MSLIGTERTSKRIIRCLILGKERTLLEQRTGSDLIQSRYVEQPVWPQPRCASPAQAWALSTFFNSEAVNWFPHHLILELGFTGALP